MVDKLIREIGERRSYVHVDFMTDTVIYRIKLKKYNCDPFYLLFYFTQDLLNDQNFSVDQYINDEIANYKEKWIVRTPAYKAQCRKRRHDFITHGKHGLKRPKHG
jgi:hypothetical protein